MIKEITISNFKSVQNLNLDLGRVNIFIGENGSGKTSILEAIAFGSAASQDKLAEEFLSTRGIRVTNADLMKSAFKKISANESIDILFSNRKKEDFSFNIDKYDSVTSKWSITNSTPILGEKQMKSLNRKVIESARNKGLITQLDDKQILLKDNTAYDEIKKLVDETLSGFFKENPSFVEKKIKSVDEISSFLIFAPENFFLRRFEEEGQIRPLGIRGEGLFKHLAEIFEENQKKADEIIDCLKLINWFENLNIPQDLFFSERRLNIKDRFLHESHDHFDQRSANEGFLYLLFYFTLFISNATPKFFAIDNIDNSLNPKLCAEVIKKIVLLSKQHKKQVILTTHNPAILDGLDLTDNEQRLFVIYRNTEGHTLAKRIQPQKEIKGVEPVRLSEAFVRGYIGGLPKNF